MNAEPNQDSKQIVNVLGISGGKDSTALAVYLRDRIPDMHYYFCDTGEELEETYEYLTSVETYLGKPIVRLNPERPLPTTSRSTITICRPRECGGVRLN